MNYPIGFVGVIALHHISRQVKLTHSRLRNSKLAVSTNKKYGVHQGRASSVMIYLLPSYPSYLRRAKRKRFNIYLFLGCLVRKGKYPNRGNQESHLCGDAALLRLQGPQICTTYCSN